MNEKYDHERNIIDQEKLAKIPDMRLSSITTNIKKGKTVISKDQIVQIEKEANTFSGAKGYKESEEELCSEERRTWTFDKKMNF